MRRILENQMKMEFRNFRRELEQEIMHEFLLM